MLLSQRFVWLNMIMGFCIWKRLLGKPSQCGNEFTEGQLERSSTRKYRSKTQNDIMVGETGRLFIVLIAHFRHCLARTGKRFHLRLCIESTPRISSSFCGPIQRGFCFRILETDISPDSAEPSWESPFFRTLQSPEGKAYLDLINPGGDRCASDDPGMTPVDVTHCHSCLSVGVRDKLRLILP